MRVLFDQGVPAPLRSAFVGIATVETAFERGWSTLRNGELIAEAEKSFDVFVTTDKNLRYQQNLASRKIAIVVLPTTQWPALRGRANEMQMRLHASQLMLLPVRLLRFRSLLRRRSRMRVS